MTGDQPPSVPLFDDEEEELPRQSRRRLRTDLAVGAVILVVVLVVGRALAGHGGGPDAAPTRSVAPSTGATSAVPVVPPPVPSEVAITHANGAVELRPALPPRTSQNPAACPIESCETEDAVPTGVLDAIDAVFPHGETLFKITVHLPAAPWHGALWFRQVNLLVNGKQLLVRISAPGPSDDLASGTTSDGLVYYRAAFGQYVVALQVDPGAGGTLEKLRALAHDERLLAR
jgi:hypothetical protein